MDVFSGYNQILMHVPDQEKTSFITPRVLYCYKIMIFRLKNMGDTYKRLVKRIFEKQIRRNMEVYLDDMLVKSRTTDQQSNDLAEAFQVLKQCGIKLNPAKCAFEVSTKKFIGFLVIQMGIEANLEKIQSIMEMQPSTKTNEVQRLTGRIVGLN
ncbi:hypothetical protein U1Q18_052534 [Sarracenia purpurea var. burkii]